MAIALIFREERIKQGKVSIEYTNERSIPSYTATIYFIMFEFFSFSSSYLIVLPYNHKEYQKFSEMRRVEMKTLRNAAKKRDTGEECCIPTNENCPVCKNLRQ